MDVLGPLSQISEIMDRFTAVAPGINFISYNNVELLGAPLNEESIHTSFEKKLKQLETFSKTYKFYLLILLTIY